MKVKYYDLENKRVFISGGGSGIGASIVEHFCEQGSEVYFIDINDDESNKLVDKLKAKKFKIPTYINCDLTDIKKLESTLENIIKKMVQYKFWLTMPQMIRDIRQTKWMKSIGIIEWR